MSLALLLSLALFDGQSLAGWQVDGEAQWRVAGGELVADGGGQGFLVSEGQFGDFRLSLEFWVEDTVNSGVFIRCRERNRIHPDSCYELNIWDDHPRQEARTGAIVFKFMPPLAQVSTAGRWNTLEVEARGPAIALRVNGEKTAELSDADPTPGFIALQHWESGLVKFRNFELMTLED